jgi:hypothetical protein
MPTLPGHPGLHHWSIRAPQYVESCVHRARRSEKVTTLDETMQPFEDHEHLDPQVQPGSDHRADGRIHPAASAPLVSTPNFAGRVWALSIAASSSLFRRGDRCSPAPTLSLHS